MDEREAADFRQAATQLASQDKDIISYTETAFAQGYVFDTPEDEQRFVDRLAKQYGITGEDVGTAVDICKQRLIDESDRDDD